MASKKCHYHPHRDAVTTCERCSRRICFDDKRLYRYQESAILAENVISGIGENISNYNRTLEYCILCNATALRSDINPFRIIYYLIPFILFVIVISIYFPLSAIYFSIFIVVFIVIWILQVMKARHAEDEALKFKEFLKTDEYSRTYGFLTSRGFANIDDNAQIDIYSTRSSKVGTKRPSKDRIFHMVCWQCGSELELTDKFCRNCGDPAHRTTSKEKDN